MDLSQLRALRMPVEPHLAGPADTHVRLYGGPHDGDTRLAIVGGEECLSLLPWVAERAKRTVFFWAERPPLEEIELEMPHAVVHLLHEHQLARMVDPAFPAGQAD